MIDYDFRRHVNIKYTGEEGRVWFWFKKYIMLRPLWCRCSISLPFETKDAILATNLIFRGGSRQKNPGRIRDGSGTDPERIRNGSTIRIRHGVVFLFPAIREQYVRTIYSGSVRRHYLRTYYVLSYTKHWIHHGSTRIRLVQGGIPELSLPARFYCRDPPELIFVLAMFVLIPMKAFTICTTNLSTFRKKNERERKNLNSLSSKST